MKLLCLVFFLVFPLNSFCTESVTYSTLFTFDKAIYTESFIRRNEYAGIQDTNELHEINGNYRYRLRKSGDGIYIEKFILGSGHERSFGVNGGVFIEQGGSKLKPVDFTIHDNGDVTILAQDSYRSILYLYRLQPSGTFHPSFGDAGVEVHLPGDVTFNHHITAISDDQIVLLADLTQSYQWAYHFAGHSIAAIFNENGQVSPSFGEAGYVTLPKNIKNEVILDSWSSNSVGGRPASVNYDADSNLLNLTMREEAIGLNLKGEVISNINLFEHLVAVNNTFSNQDKLSLKISGATKIIEGSQYVIGIIEDSSVKNDNKFYPVVFKLKGMSLDVDFANEGVLVLLTKEDYKFQYVAISPEGALNLTIKGEQQENITINETGELLKSEGFIRYDDDYNIRYLSLSTAELQDYFVDDVGNTTMLFLDDTRGYVIQTNASGELNYSFGDFGKVEIPNCISDISHDVKPQIKLEYNGDITVSCLTKIYYLSDTGLMKLDSTLSVATNRTVFSKLNLLGGVDTIKRLWRSEQNLYYLSIERFDENGVLVEDFGDGGRVEIVSTVNDLAFVITQGKLIHLDDGSLIVAYSATLGTANKLELVKLDSSGKQVSSFGDSGLLSITGITGEYPSFLQLMSDGSAIMAVKNKYLDRDNVNTPVSSLYRFTQSGQLQPNFGEKGRVIIDTNKYITALIEVEDGSIYVILKDDVQPRTSLLALNVDGEPNVEFGMSGRIQLPQNWQVVGKHTSSERRLAGSIMVAGDTNGKINFQQLALKTTSNLKVVKESIRLLEDSGQYDVQFALPHQLDKPLEVIVSPELGHIKQSQVEGKWHISYFPFWNKVGRDEFTVSAMTNGDTLMLQFNVAITNTPDGLMGLLIMLKEESGLKVGNIVGMRGSLSSFDEMSNSLDLNLTFFRWQTEGNELIDGGRTLLLSESDVGKVVHFKGIVDTENGTNFSISLQSDEKVFSDKNNGDIEEQGEDSSGGSSTGALFIMCCLIWAIKKRANLG